jgi:hypothetical protein
MQSFSSLLISYPDIVSEKVSHDALDDVEANVSSKKVSKASIIPCMTHVRVIIDSGPTHIPRHEVLVLMPWHENFLSE